PIDDSINFLVAAEYFWDNDPGTNNGTAVSFPTAEIYAPGSSVVPALAVPVPQLSLGPHYLGFRVKTAGGNWTGTERTGVILGRRTDFALLNTTNVITLTNTSNIDVPTVSCTNNGQICSSLFTLPIQTSSLLLAQFISQACSNLRMHFLVDGQE